MLRLSKKMWFTIEAVVDIAFHAGGQPVQSHQITRRQGIPKRYLEQALQQLVRAGILTGIRGPQGGYRLARERRRISIGEVVRVVEDPVGTRGMGVVFVDLDSVSEKIIQRLFTRRPAATGKE